MTTYVWFWLYAGVFLMLAELLAPGFVIFFFGLSAATVSLCCYLFGEAFNLTWQMASFSVFTVAYLIFLRRVLCRVFDGTRETSCVDFGHETVGRLGRLTQPIAPPMPGRVLIGDAEWDAMSDRPIAAGADVKVVAQENLTMRVEPVNGGVA